MMGNHFLKRLWPVMVAAIVAIFNSGAAVALGLGEIKLNSALNEPLEAEISLLSVGDLSEEELLVGLASEADFLNLGVERIFMLSSLRFEVVLDSRNPVVKVTSQQPIREPYLDFLVELQWPSGRMLREYTLLLDLPVFAAQKEPVEQRLESPRSASPTAAAPRAKEPGVAPPPVDFAAGDAEYRVQSGDTAWGIARKVRPQGYSIEQTLSALYHLNPNAFINGDVGLLKKGYVVRLPQGSDVVALGRTPVNDVARDAENNLTETTALEAISAGAATDPVPEQQQASQGRLKLSALSDDSSSASLGLGAEAADANEEVTGIPSAAGDEKIAIVEEELLKTQRENEDLKARLSSLEEQIATMRRMVEINDESMRALQQGAAQQQSAVKPPAQQQAKSSWLNYLLYGGIILVGLILAAVLMLRNRKSASPASELPAREAYLAPVPAQAADEDAAEDERVQDEPLYSDHSPLAGIAKDQQSEDLSGLELDEDEEVDPEGEADIHISLGSYAKAEEILKNALDEDPENTALHLKLLEVFVAMGDLQQFDMQRAILSELDDPQADAKAAKMRLEFAESDAAQDDSWNTAIEEERSVLDPNQDEADEGLEGLGELEGLDKWQGLGALDSDFDRHERKVANEEDEAQAATDFDLNLDLDDVDLDELSSDIDELTFDASADQAADADEFKIEIPGFDDDGLPEANAGEVDRDDEPYAGIPDAMPAIDTVEECETKLDLADAYLEMGDPDGAKEILDEVVQEGSDEQKARARALLEKIA